ncbi:hypothetical protein EXN66_Car014309 [Channa argus]|uniref:Uncharacterized protein n=1 Tax=Channa argus TaxID=215402 RepID=A0A6G1Q7X6_CHAAH|nr:hypothetical protein EXN66_Car014309 [Channa argus]
MHHLIAIPTQLREDESSDIMSRETGVSEKKSINQRKQTFFSDCYGRTQKKHGDTDAQPAGRYEGIWYEYSFFSVCSFVASLLCRCVWVGVCDSCNVCNAEQHH